MGKNNKRNIACAALAGLVLKQKNNRFLLFSKKSKPITIAEMNWASASFMAHVDKIILEEGYGYSVKLVPGATFPTATSMFEKGQPDVAPELWSNSIMDKLNNAVDDKIHIVNKAPIEGLGEGWWVLPHTLKKHPELTTADAILKRPDLFPHPEDSSKGGFHICPAGWGCQISNTNLYKAWDMEAKGWKIVETESVVGFDGSIAKAAKRGENWFGYYWSPTAIIGEHKMQTVDMGEYAGKDNWNNCIAIIDCEDPKKSSWIPHNVYTVVSNNFKKTAGEKGMVYLKKRVYIGNTMNEMLFWMSENQASGEEAVMYFLSNYKEIWHQWVGHKQKIKIEKYLK